MKRKFIKSIDKQKSIARKAVMETLKDILTFVLAIIRVIGIFALIGFLFYKIPIWIGEIPGYGWIDFRYIYLIELGGLFIIPGLYLSIGSIYERNYQRIANEICEGPLAFEEDNERGTQND